MRWNLLFLPLAILTQHLSFCASDVEENLDQLESDISRIRTDTPMGTYGAKTASAAPQIAGYDVIVAIDFLWWKCYEGGTDYALKNEKGPISATSIKGPLKHLNFDWEPGYRISLGTLLAFEGWDAHLDFTSFQTHAQSSTSSNTTAISPLYGVTTSGFSHAHAHWHVHFYNLALLLGRSYFVSPNLALHPYFGLSSAWIRQTRKARYRTPTDLKLHGKNDFWGIGPELGAECHFYLDKNLSLYGNIAGTLFWGKFDVKETERNLTQQTEEYDLHDDLHRMTGAVNAGLGLAYERKWDDDRYALMAKIGYEGQYFWRQNQFPLFNASANIFSRQSDDLSFQGLTLEARFIF